ncbi:hypothetical protein J3459_014660 [Metarhizium acridum]|uniref:uncharacterized protein n=1 Tax=Metarhizium acridum TaxID=92637 RepID=UPI001C6D12D8|nr:hypothetical protein J3458_014518 [Metarhizium acridum]KAG8414526.1 hypothetical protein J3459_014660 [Metarhizium acridum]
MVPSLDPVNQGHPSTSGLIEAIYKGNMEATRSAAPVFPRRRAGQCSSARGGSPSPSDTKRAAPYTWRGIQTTFARLYPNRIFAQDMQASKLDRSDIELAAKAEDWPKEMGRTG